MTKLIRRDRPLTDLIDWVENEMSMAPLLHRPLLAASPCASRSRSTISTTPCGWRSPASTLSAMSS